MLILLPPSQAKASPSRGRPLDLDRLRLPALHEHRTAVLAALVQLSLGPAAEARRVLGPGPTQHDALLGNAGLPSAPTRPAREVDRGVLDEALGLTRLPATAARRASAWLLVCSGLWGAVRPADRIPAHRLPGSTVLPGIGPLARSWQGPPARAFSTLPHSTRSGLVLDLRSSAYAPMRRPSQSMAERTVTVRVVHDLSSGAGSAVSHQNKATKGRLARGLLLDGGTPRTGGELREHLTRLGWTVAEGPRPNTLDVAQCLAAQSGRLGPFTRSVGGFRHHSNMSSISRPDAVLHGDPGVRCPASDIVDGLIGELHTTLGRLLAAPAAATESRGDVVARLLRAQARLEAVTLTALAAFDAVDGATASGDGSTAVWLSRATTTSPAQAAGMVRSARVLHEHLPATRAALAAGDISGRHANAVVAVVGRVGARHAQAAEPLLLDLARRAEPGAVRAAGRYLHEVLDPAGAERACSREYERRGVSFSISGSGSGGRGYLEGVLDPESAEQLQAALMPLMAPTPGDTRTATQRRADALVDLARRALDVGDLPAVTGTGQRPHVSVVVEASTLAGGGGVGVLPWTSAAIGWGSLRRLSCDARLTPVLTRLHGSGTGGAGAWLPIAVGRSSRTVTPSQAAALRVRDGGCVIPGCSRTYAFTHAHHVQHWADGGPTDLNNLVLLCGHHHRALHQGHWVVRPVADGEGFEVTDRHGRTQPAQHAGNRAPPAGLAASPDPARPDRGPGSPDPGGAPATGFRTS